MWRSRGGAHRLVHDLHGLAEEGLGAGVVAHGLVQQGQVVQARGVVGVALAQGLLPDLQRLAVERLGAGVVARGPVQPGQLVEGRGVVGVVLTQQLAPDLHDLAARTDSLRVLPLSEHRNLKPIQSNRLLEPLPLVRGHRGAPVEIGQCPTGVTDPPILPVRLPLADGEHFREGFPCCRPVVARLLQPGKEFKRDEHVLVQLAQDVASDGKLLYE